MILSISLVQGFAYITYLSSIGLNPIIGNELFFQLASLYLDKSKIDLKLNKSKKVESAMTILL